MVAFTYLVTRDLVETLEGKIGYDLASSELRAEIRALELGFLNEFWEYIPDTVNKVALGASELSAEMNRFLKESKYPIVSLDRVYISDANAFLDVARITDSITGKILRIAERPGTKDLVEQIEDIREFEQIALVDVGAFDGTTLSNLCKSLYLKGIQVQSIALGVTNSGALEKIRTLVIGPGDRDDSDAGMAEGEYVPIEVSQAYTFDLLEWIELRDFFGIDGRAIGLSGDGQRQFIPYWENLGWASIAGNDQSAVEELCKRYNAKLCRLLDNAGYDLKDIGEAVSIQGGDNDE